jgi:hypothetical protein
MREPGQRLGIELAREHERIGREAPCLFTRRGLVEHRHHFLRAVCKRRHHGGRREKNVEHDDHLARHAHRLELFLLREHVQLVLEIDSCGQRKLR